jgi:hypothetical protein
MNHWVAVKIEVLSCEFRVNKKTNKKKKKQKTKLTDKKKKKKKYKEHNFQFLQKNQ